jgi:hypothetical protein
VRDEQNQTVFGAAVLVDHQEIFTDSDGIFALPEKKGGEYDFKVDLANFLFPGTFEVVSAPPRIRTTTTDGADHSILVTLRRSSTSPGVN